VETVLSNIFIKILPQISASLTVEVKGLQLMERYVP
jgi:hypothetical protein